jgi:hypothetical protein
MIEKSYFYRKSNDDQYFNYSSTRIELREYISGLTFYNPFENQKAEFAIFDKTPYDLGEVELRDHGKFSSCITVNKPIKYSNKNFDTLQQSGTISFYLGVNKLNGYSKQTIFLDKWPENMPEDDYSFTITAGRESIKPCNFHLEENATKEDVLNTILVSVDPAIFKAEVDISGDISNVIIKSVYPGEVINLTDGTYGTNLLSILDVGDKIFGCYPETDQEVLAFVNDDGRYDINVIHANLDNVSYLKVALYDGNSSLATELKTKWENDSSTLNNIEINFDYDVAYLFIDGELKDFKATNFKREFGGELWLCGTNEYPYTFDELIIFSSLTHTASFTPRTTQLTKYTSTRPYIDFFWKGNDISSTSLNQLVVNSTPNIHFILYADNQAYYYLSGSWRNSDGTFSQSNDLGTFVAKIPEFDLNNQEIFIRAFFDSDGTSPAWIENIYFELDDTSIYGDEAEAPAILVGTKEHGDELIDMYNKTLIITTDKGTTEITFDGPLTLSVNDECEVMTGCNEFVLDFDNEDILQQALNQIPVVILAYQPFTISKDILIKEILKLNENIILELGGFTMTGENTEARIILLEGAKITGNGINLERAGTYKWNGTAFAREPETIIVGTKEEFLSALENEDNVLISDETAITLSSADEFNVPSGTTITVNGKLTISDASTGHCYGVIDVYGEFINNAGLTWGWTPNGAEDNGKIIIHSGAEIYQNGTHFIGTDDAIITLTSGTLTLAYEENVLNGEATTGSITLFDPYVVAAGSTLTVKAGATITLSPAGEYWGTQRLGGSLTGNVVYEE